MMGTGVVVGLGGGPPNVPPRLGVEGGGLAVEGALDSPRLRLFEAGSFDVP